MSTYTIRIENVTRTGTEPVELHEYSDVPCFCKPMYENTVAAMFFYAAQSIEYKHLIATVSKDGKIVMLFAMSTRVDGSEIWATLAAMRPGDRQPLHLRTMNIAE